MENNYELTGFEAFHNLQLSFKIFIIILVSSQFKNKALNEK